MGLKDLLHRSAGHLYGMRHALTSGCSNSSSSIQKKLHIVILDGFSSHSPAKWRVELGDRLAGYGDCKITYWRPGSDSGFEGDYIVSPEERVSISELKETMAAGTNDPLSKEEYRRQLDALVARHEAAPKRGGLYVERKGIERYLLFPAVKELITAIDASVISRMTLDPADPEIERRKQTELLRKNPDIFPYVPIEISGLDSKVKQAPILGAALGDNFPRTCCFLRREQGYTLQEIQVELQRQGLSEGIVKGACGFMGNLVYNGERLTADVAKAVLAIDGVIVQERVPAGNPEQFVRIALYVSLSDYKVLGSLINTAESSSFLRPAKDALTPEIGKTIHRKSKQRLYEPSEQEVDTAVCAARAILRAVGINHDTWVPFGIDIIPGSTPKIGAKILEVDSGPSIEGPNLTSQGTAVSMLAKIFYEDLLRHKNRLAFKTHHFENTRTLE